MHRYFIESERIGFSVWTTDDLDDALSLFSSPQVARYLCAKGFFTDEEIIARLKEASCAGVKITLFVRGISCILPGIAGKTDNIEIRALVGRYLEHSRIYVFSEGEDEKMFISSADFMTRNTERRVEVAVPIYDPDCRDRIHHMIDIYMADNTKARLLASNGRYHKIHDSEDPFSAQDAVIKEEDA